MSFESYFIRVNETFANLQASHKILGWSNKFGDIGHRKEGEVQVQDIQTSGMRNAGWLMSKHPWVKERCESKRICLPITLARSFWRPFVLFAKIHASPLFFLLQCQGLHNNNWFREKKNSWHQNKCKQVTQPRRAASSTHIWPSEIQCVVFRIILNCTDDTAMKKILSK